MEHIKSLAVLFVAVAFSLGFSSCGDDDEVNTPTDKEYNSDYDYTAMSQLAGTKWKLAYMYDGKTKTYVGDNSIIYFSENYFSAGAYELFYNDNLYGRWWVMKEGGKLFVSWYGDSVLMGEKYGGVGCQIFTLTSSELIIGHEKGYKWYYVNANMSGDYPSGGSSFGEAPSFYDFSYTYSETTIDVIFATNPISTNAKIYYGKDSPTTQVSTNITGRMISAHISGLTKGTTYYVKCIASNSAGSTTSSTYKVRTDYY